MNLFYEDYPTTIDIVGEKVKILTDFRDCIQLMDMLKDDTLDTFEKVSLIREYILLDPNEYDLNEALEKLCDFISMESLKADQYGDTAENEEEGKQRQKNLFSFSIDYPYIFSAFLQDYGINIRAIQYMHWWEFRMLFDGLSENTEIKQRIMYRGIDLNSIKDNEERKRIARIQRAIMLPEDVLTDFDIGDALW